MDPIDPAPSESREIAYHFSRAVCLGWTVFFSVLVIACILVVVVAGDQRFAEGLVPGWLFGSLGAALFSVMGLSWAGRFLYSGPALTLSEAGITADKRLGGLTTPRIDGTIAWEEVEGAWPGAHGSVVLRLADPDAFWARQSRLSRIMAWHPSPERRTRVSLGGNDLGAASTDVVSRIESFANPRRLSRDLGRSDPPSLTAEAQDRNSEEG